MTNFEIREWLNEQIANLERYRPYESLRFFMDDQEVLIGIRDRLAAADKLAEASGTLVNEQGDQAYRHEPDPIKSELRFWKFRGALREYRGEKGGEA